MRTNPVGEGLNIYRQGGWRGQLQRTRRWYSRLAVMQESHIGDEDERCDFLYAFFQNCSYLADWAVLDLTDGAAQVKLLMDNTIELHIARDIANATKHFTLTRPPRVKDGFADGREYVPAPLRGGESSTSPFIIAAWKKYDPLDLARRCMEAWDQFAEAHTASAQ